jgi:hypothetical protein
MKITIFVAQHDRLGGGKAYFVGKVSTNFLV